MLTIEEIWKLIELAKTEEAKHYIRIVNQLCREISLAVDALDLSDAEPKWLIDRMLDGFHRAQEIHRAVPKRLCSTAEDDCLLFALQYFEAPEVVLEAYFWIALGQRCGDEAHSRLLPVVLNIAGLVFLQEAYKREDFEAIMKMLRAYTQELYLPQEVGTSEHKKEKDSTLSLLLIEQIDKLRNLSVEDFFIQAMEGKVDYLPENIRNQLISVIRTQNAKKRMPSGGFMSLDEDKEDEHGEKVPMLEFLEADRDKLQTQPMTKVEEELTQAQRQQLENLLGKKGLKIFEYRYRHSEIVGQGEGKEISQALGIAESTVGRYIGTKNRIGILEAKANEIRSIVS